jgi:hypothetical protein
MNHSELTPIKQIVPAAPEPKQVGPTYLPRFVEQIGRRFLAVLAPKEAKSIKAALEQLVTSAQDELLGQGLFRERKAEGDRATLLQEQIVQWQ